MKQDDKAQDDKARSRKNDHRLLKRMAEGALLGIGLGAFVVHPAAMLVHGLTYPELRLDFQAVATAFSPEHLPMALFFALLGGGLGFALAYYITERRMEEERVHRLETLLPICSSCKRIRIDDNTEQPAWLTVEAYLARRTGAGLTHGICPRCDEAFRKKYGIQRRAGALRDNG